MNGYMISTQDAPGLAARLLEATAARGVNAAEALARMRAHAFAGNQALLALALEILAGDHLLEDE